MALTMVFHLSDSEQELENQLANLTKLLIQSDSQWVALIDIHLLESQLVKRFQMDIALSETDIATGHQMEKLNRMAFRSDYPSELFPPTDVELETDFATGHQLEMAFRSSELLPSTDVQLVNKCKTSMAIALESKMTECM